MSFIFFFILSFSFAVEAGEIALTIDDAPRGNGQIFSGVQRTQKFIEVLKKNDVQAMFFVNTEKLPRDKGHSRIAAYSAAGHIIANRTHSHPNLDKTPAQKYIADIDQADNLLKEFPTFRKWFRYPFLREGATPEARDQVRNHLQKTGYRNGYVTIDNYDYFVDNLVQIAMKDGKKVDLERACEMLVDLMWDGIEFYDNVAKKHLGNVRHVLLMHENDLEAFCLDTLIAHIRAKGWKIVSPEEAYADPILATNEHPKTMYLNQGRVAALVHEKTGIKFISKWESEGALRTEFAKRSIVQE